MDPEEYGRRLTAAPNGTSLTKPSKWTSADLVHIERSHLRASTSTARTLLMRALDDFAIAASERSLPAPPPVRLSGVTESEGDAAAEFMLPPNADTKEVLHALVSKDGLSVANALRHTARVHESREGTTTTLQTSVGAFELREASRPGGLGLGGLRTLSVKSANGAGLAPMTIERLAAAFCAAHRMQYALSTPLQSLEGPPAAATSSATPPATAASTPSTDGGAAAVSAQRPPPSEPRRRNSHAGTLAALGSVSNTGENVKQSPSERLEDLGARVFLPSGGGGANGEDADPTKSNNGGLLDDAADRYAAGRWGGMVGYAAQKAEVEEALLMPLLYPEVFSEVNAGTREAPKASCPKAVLLHGPPGTGKTSTARALADRSGLPMVYLPLEAVVSKWFGEGEQKLSEVFDAREGSSMHEASRRTLSVLLRKIDGFERSERTVVLGATNRQQDLDPALLSRFDVAIEFPLPKADERLAIFARNAKHLSDGERSRLAARSEGLSGRNLLDVCEATERRWACRRLRREVQEPLPDEAEYLRALGSRQHFMAASGQ